MSAPIINLGDRNSSADDSRYSVYAGPFYGERAGRATFSTAGQLWQRVQDNSPARSTIRQAGRKAGLVGTTARQCATPATFGTLASGVIRGGIHIA